MKRCLSVPVQQLKSETLHYMMIKCGLRRKNSSTALYRKKTLDMWETYFRGRTINLYWKPFSKECVKTDAFLFHGQKIPCAILPMIRPEDLRGGFQYLFCAPMVYTDDSLSLLERFLADSLQGALLDAARDYLRLFLLRQTRTKTQEIQYLTPSFGPGFFGMDMAAVRILYNDMDGKDTGIIVNDYGMMEPLKSVIGMYLTLGREVVFPVRDCSGCLAGHRGCEFCKGAAADAVTEEWSEK
ncbi:MAG: hypothetical protein ACOX8E_02340 [Ruminococcus sp.]